MVNVNKMKNVAICSMAAFAVTMSSTSIADAAPVQVESVQAAVQTAQARHVETVNVTPVQSISSAVKVGDTIKGKDVKKGSLGYVSGRLLIPKKGFLTWKVRAIQKDNTTGKYKVWLAGFAGGKGTQLYDANGKPLAKIAGSYTDTYFFVDNAVVGGKTIHQLNAEKKEIKDNNGKVLTKNFTNVDNGKNQYIKSVKFDAGARKFVVNSVDNQTGSLGDALSSGSSMRVTKYSNAAIVKALNSGQLYKEAAALGLPTNNLSIKQQLDCHVRGSKVTNNDWDLEYDRPALKNTSYQTIFGCNVQLDYNGPLKK